MKTLLLIALASLTCSAANAQNSQISIHLYNLSGIRADALDRATREASRIFAKVNVSVIWTMGNPEAEEAHVIDQFATAAVRDVPVRPYVVVSVARGPVFHVPSGTLGMSLPHAQSGISATIFQERIGALSDEVGQDFSLLLGHVIAHEIGHVALASDAHSPNGIMRARWGQDEFDLAAMGHLGFNPHQGAEIRAYASRAASTVRLEERHYPAVAVEM